MEKQLKDRSYYENRYDHQTIRIMKNLDKVNKEREEKGKPNFGEFAMLMRKYDRYEHRNKVIDEWLEKDKKLDALYDNCKEPVDTLRCRMCNKVMELELKELDIGYSTKTDRVLFIYRCNDCGKGRALYNDGKEYEVKKEECKKCENYITYDGKFEGDVFIKKYSCYSCGSKYTEKEDFSTNRIKEEPITPEEIEKYGYSKKDEIESEQFHSSLYGLKELMLDEKDEKIEKENNEKLKKIKKYNLFQLEELINKGLNKTDFTSFKVIKKEQVKTYMKAEFEAYYKGNYGIETNKKLYKVLKKILFSSNWKIQDYKTTEKLGVLNGFILGYDRNEDIIKINQNKMGK